MNTSLSNASGVVSHQCPICGKRLPYEPSLPRFDAPCSECGCTLWCRRRASTVDVVLEVLPDRTPEPEEVEQLVAALVRSHAATRVVVDLSRLDSIDSRLTARLVSMNKFLQSSGGRFVLCGLCPIVREILFHFRLDRVFEIIDSEEPEPAMA